MPTVNPKFTTEIWPDFKVERHEDYTVIWPMRFYRNEEEKDSGYGDGKSQSAIWLRFGWWADCGDESSWARSASDTRPSCAA